MTPNGQIAIPLDKAAIREPVFSRFAYDLALSPSALATKPVSGDVAEWSKALPC